MTPSVEIPRDAATDQPLLLQHRLNPQADPWRTVTISMLLTRTRPVVVEPAARKLLKRYPSAGSLARAHLPTIVRNVTPLGLQNRRGAALILVAKAFWELPRQPREAATVETPQAVPSRAWVRALPGCGDYVEEAYRLLVLDDDSFEPDDWALHEYWEWLRGVRGQ